MPHILVINPNISESVTSLIEQEARKAAHADTRISMATAAFGVEYIETRSEAAIGAHAVLDIVANAGDAFDAIVIAAFGDPGVKAAKEIVNTGKKEIVLTGVNIGDFGKGVDESFIDLINELDKVKDIDRIRISSIEPNLLTNEIIEFCDSSIKFMPHYHIPLQSGSNKILRAMRRRYDKKVYKNKIKKIKEKNPDTCIGVDVIVGFPGESKEDFL